MGITSDSYFSALFDKDRESFMLFGNRRNSEIIKQNESSNWILKLKDENQCLLQTKLQDADGVLPIGRRSWRDCNSNQVVFLHNFNTNPTNQNLQDVMLSLSSCKLGTEFSCDDGTCVPLDYKCDWFKDCPQGEDEEECSTLDVPGNYQRQVTSWWNSKFRFLANP